jgi:pimeloyl-ACP methyl ester carboxylesterase
MPTVSANGIDINYVDEGQGDTLVLLHNVVANLHMFDFNVPELSQHIRAIAFDQRGWGLSSKPEDGLNFETMAEDLYQLLRARNVDSLYLLGQAAMGIGIAMTFFMHHMDMVKGLIFSSGGSLATHQPHGIPLGESTVNPLKELAKEAGMMAVLEKRKETLLFWAPRFTDEPRIWDRFVVMHEQASVPAWVNLPERVLPERRQAWIEQLNKWGGPVLQLVGIEDLNPTQVIDMMRGYYPATQAVILPYAGHYLAIENPDDFNHTILNFMAGVERYGK